MVFIFLCEDCHGKRTTVQENGTCMDCGSTRVKVQCTPIEYSTPSGTSAMRESLQETRADPTERPRIPNDTLPNSQSADRSGHAGGFSNPTTRRYAEREPRVDFCFRCRYQLENQHAKCRACGHLPTNRDTGSPGLPWYGLYEAQWLRLNQEMKLLHVRCCRQRTRAFRRSSYAIVYEPDPDLNSELIDSNSNGRRQSCYGDKGADDLRSQAAATRRTFHREQSADAEPPRETCQVRGIEPSPGAFTTSHFMSGALAEPEASISESHFEIQDSEGSNEMGGQTNNSPIAHPSQTQEQSFSRDRHPDLNIDDEIDASGILLRNDEASITDHDISIVEIPNPRSAPRSNPSPQELATRIVDMFHIMWDVEDEEVERANLVELWKSAFTRGKVFYQAVELVDKHAFGDWSAPPPTPRPCLMAQVKSHGKGKGGLRMTSRNCAHCKAKTGSRIPKTCIWALFAPGIDEPFGPRINGACPVRNRHWQANVTNLTVAVEGKQRRWLLFKRWETPGALRDIQRMVDGRLIPTIEPVLR